MSDQINNWARLVPELSVKDIKASLFFWCDLIGFSVAYDRPEEGFAYLDLNGAQIMLEQRNEADNSWETGPFEPPLGRGINFQIEVPDIEPIIDRLTGAGFGLFVDVEEKWYRAGALEFGQKQFLVMDPDGYLLRLIKDLGERTA
ncbi:bleomycin resistance protein [Pedobacter caeni]|uniref:Bleomycin resistance protein n=1 Tax=Pedobacter caeni TaxID=288992 RepID=A0A1M4VK06_9SPHI|nr:VOC family protein [Pedobacter caeni]SHE69200.1 Catechol 2,3-dioxygenase [Pedobacter caeni]